MDIPEAAVAEFVRAVGADRPSPGAGAAAAVALALGAACAAKALVISGRRREDDGLAAAAAAAERIATRALGGAQRDCEDFPALLHADSEDRARAALQADGDALLGACAELRALLDAHGGAVEASLEGDLLAARDLLEASARILGRIRGELAQD